jgi:predicted acyltransferase
VKLFAIGLFVINGNNQWNNFRFPGVLQRIAISYFINSIAHLILFPHVTVKGVVDDKNIIKLNFEFILRRLPSLRQKI